MPNIARTLMDSDEFLHWCLDQDDRYELVEGIPVKMMTGASNRHDQIIVNVIIALGQQLRGTGYRPATADIAVKTRIRSIRRPDVTVTCDPPSKDTYDAATPKMVVEVLSPSNRGIAWQRKLEEYRNRDGLIYILIVESDAPAAILLTRLPGMREWTDTDVDGLDATIELPEINCRLPMSDLYAEIDFTAEFPPHLPEG
ncbi:MAG: Uma2 family endonuclease [Hyphomicrobiaceae bacterium]